MFPEQSDASASSLPKDRQLASEISFSREVYVAQTTGLLDLKLTSQAYIKAIHLVSRATCTRW